MIASTSGFAVAATQSERMRTIDDAGAAMGSRGASKAMRGFHKPRRKAAVLFIHDLGADLANGGVLVASAAAATDRADQLAAFDQRKPAGARDQRRIKRAHIAMAGFKGVVEQPRLPAKARRGAGLADRNRTGGDLRALHPREMHQFPVGVDHGDVHLPVTLLGFGL